MDKVLLAAVDGRPIPTEAVDALPPWRARLVVSVALRSGAVLERGTAEEFDRAACDAGLRDAGARGWWSLALAAAA